jgi:hypothetical protein
MQGLQIKNLEPSCVSTDPLVEAFYHAMDDNTMADFLEEKAGLWWYPILNAPLWLDMFKNASNLKAKNNAERFRHWLLEYQPSEGYNGWMGFTDGRSGSIRPSASSVRSAPATLTNFFAPNSQAKTAPASAARGG